ncbi:MAG: glycosyltransferase family 9 protein, partial [Bacteroidales bacterium]
NRINAELEAMAKALYDYWFVQFDFPDAKGRPYKSSGGKMVWNACGKYNINQSASLVRQADLVITHDTGLMHIAAAFKKRIISVWGNTIPEFGMSPYMPHPDSAMFEVDGLKCRPCSKLGYKRCPKKHFRCMNDQKTSDIAGYAARLQNQSTTGFTKNQS